MRIGSGGFGDKIKQGRRAIRLHFSVSGCVAAQYVHPNNTELANCIRAASPPTSLHADNSGRLDR